MGLFQISQKERFFRLLYQPSALGIISQSGSPLCTLPKKVFLSPSVGVQEDNLSGNATKRRVYWFVLICCQDVLCSHRQSRNMTMSTFIMVILPPYVRDSFDDKSMLFLYFRKAFPLTLLGHPFERRAYRLLFCFEIYQGIPYSCTVRVDTRWWTLWSWLILILHVRD